MSVKGFFPFLLFLGCINANAVLAQYAQEDWKARDRWMKVPTLIDFLDIEEGGHVADVGCHEGYFSFHLSKKVGSTGRVYAVDVEQYRIDTLKEHIKDSKTENIIPITGDYDNPKLPINTMDAVIVMDTYHEMDAHNSILSHIKTALKPKGKLLILEKFKKHKRGKSRKEQVEAHTLSSNYVRQELEAAGFSIIKAVKNFGNWKNEADKPMWILVAIPQEQ